MSNTTSEVYLVLGGEGFLGHNIINQLLERKNSTHPNIKIKSFDIQKRYDLADVEVIVGDMCSYQDLKDAFQGVTTVIQTASPIASAPDHLFWKVNVEGMKNVVKVCQDVGVKKLVFTSSASVVYGGEPLNGVDETSPYPQKFVDVYSETKSIAEKMVLEANSTSLATVSLRVAGLFGIGDRQMIPRLVNLHETGQTKVQVGDNTNLFDYTYIENAAYAHLLAADKLPSPEVSGNSFFITNTTPIPFWDMPRRVWGILGLEKSLQYTLPYSVGISIAHAVDYLLWAISPIKKIEITLKPYAIRHSCSNRYFNTEKAQNILGYKPLFSLEEGLQKTLKSIIDEKNSKN